MNASESWSAQREALAVETLRGAGRLRLRVYGESMLPSLWPGDIAEITACSLGDIGSGEIVLALRNDRLFLHRFLVRSAEDGFLTRGDSMPGPDPAFASAALLGRLVTVFRDGQFVDPTARPWSRMIGLLLCYCSPARRLALRLQRSGHRRRAAAVDLETA